MGLGYRRHRDQAWCSDDECMMQTHARCCVLPLFVFQLVITYLSYQLVQVSSGYPSLGRLGNQGRGQGAVNC